MEFMGCCFCSNEYYGHDKGPCLTCNNHSNYHYSPERAMIYEEEKKRKEKMEWEEKQKQAIQKDELSKVENRGSDCGTDLIRRDRVAQMVIWMIEENENFRAHDQYSAALQGGWKVCLETVLKKIKELEPEPATKAEHDFIMNRFSKVL